MSLKLIYYGQNDSVNCTPDVVLTGDPGTDQTTLINSGYLGGRIMAIAGNPQHAVGVESVIVPCDVDANPNGTSTETATAGLVIGGVFDPNSVPYTSNATTTVAAGNVPFAVLINGPGEFAGAIGPSGSKKAPVVRALFQGNVNQESYDSGATFIAGQYVYCGSTSKSNVGLYTAPATQSTTTSANYKVVGICTHVPTTQEPWLGVASLL
jgi:hypothetical protein